MLPVTKCYPVFHINSYMRAYIANNTEKWVTTGNMAFLG